MALLPALLGINLWLTALVVPLWLAGGHAALWVWLALPLSPLLLIFRRAGGRGDGRTPPIHEEWPDLLAPLRLLCIVPLCALVPGAEIALGPDARTPRGALFLQAAALLTYLAVQSSHLTRRGAGTTSSRSPGSITTPLVAQEVPRRWLRRIVIYRSLLGYAALLPLLLLYALTQHPPIQRALRLSFPEPTQLSAVQAAACGALGLLLVVLFHGALLAPLRVHLEHDRAVTAELLALRQLARRGRPRPQFYLALVLSLASMILLAYRSLYP